MMRHLNRAAAELLGCSDEPTYKNRPYAEFVARRTWKIYDASDNWVESEERPLGRALRGEATPETSQRVLRKDGSSRWIVVSGTPVYERGGKLLAAVSSIRDVTDEKEAVAQLRRVTSEQRTVLNTIRMGLALLRRRRFDWVNSAFLTMFGYMDEEIRGVESSVFYADAEQFARVGREGYLELARGGSYSTTALMRRRDGGEFWCNISGQAVDPSNVDEGTIWVLQDVTEQRNQENALRDSERMLAEVFKASPAIIIVSHAETGQLIECNDAFTRLTGFERDDVIGKTSIEIGLWQNAERRAEAMQLFRQAGRLSSWESQLSTRTGESLDCLLSGAFLSISGEACLVWVITDLTEYKRVERNAREGETRFRRLAENSNDWIVVTDEAAVVNFCVGPVKALLGCELDEVAGRSLYELAHPDDVHQCRETLAALREALGTSRRIEMRLRHRQGHFVEMEAVACNWLGDEIIQGVVWNLREITQRKLAEQERAKLQEQLQQSIKMEAIGRLAGGVAHDFNNLLTVISGNVELAMEGLAPMDPLVDTLGEVRRAAESAASLTHQLLAFSRQQIIEPRSVRLNDLINNLRKMLRRLIGEDIELHVELTDGLGVVRIDPGQFEQVVVNLVVNARDAMPKGGALEIQTLPATLDEAYCNAHPGTRPGTYVMLAVTDSGQGMSEEVRERAFEPFFTTKEQGHGTGLGLAMCFGVVKQAGGTIELYSELGHGTTFKLYLPCVDEPAARIERSPSNQRLLRGSETVLLVEDERSVRDLAETLLRRLGYNVIVAANGEQALQLARGIQAPIHLLLTDVIMPGLNGRELAERLSEIHPEARILFTSGYTENVMIHHGVLSESLSFIGKPYSLQALAQKLRQVLGGDSS